MSHTAGALVRSRATTSVALRRSAVALSVVLALQTTGASAQSQANEAPPEPSAPSPAQALYKGVVGNLLEAVPIDPESRVQLQRFSAVVGSPLSGHSLAITLGIAAPPLMILGFIWGLWSANQIQRADTLADRGRATGPQSAVAGTQTIALEDRPSALRGQRTAMPQPADDPGAALEALMRSADARALATVVGGASSVEPLVPCENCIMPMLYFRPAPDVR